MRQIIIRGLVYFTPLIVDLVINGLEKLAARTDNNIDDDMVKTIKDHKILLEQAIKSI